MKMKNIIFAIQLLAIFYCHLMPQVKSKITDDEYQIYSLICADEIHNNSIDTCEFADYTITKSDLYPLRWNAADSLFTGLDLEPFKNQFVELKKTYPIEKSKIILPISELIHSDISLHFYFKFSRVAFSSDSSNAIVYREFNCNTVNCFRGDWYWLKKHDNHWSINKFAYAWQD
jgi:hypothetical protein